jgi:Putative beta-lactamase-inhibitor-like, PepSY-like
VTLTRVFPPVIAFAFAVSVAGAAQQPAPARAAKPAAAPSAPAPILAAFKAAYPHATIKSAAAEKEDGKVVWEVESTENGLGRDLLYTPDGTVVEIEEEVPSAQLPTPVTAGVKAQYPSARIVKGEKVTRGATVSYELELAGAAKKSVVLTPEGRPVASK